MTAMKSTTVRPHLAFDSVPVSELRVAGVLAQRRRLTQGQRARDFWPYRCW
jgi:hypothetical protein